MPELPEITVLAQQMEKELVGRSFNGVEVVQPKCLNLPPEIFVDRVVGQQIVRVYPHGKWIITVTTDGYLLVNLRAGKNFKINKQLISMDVRIDNILNKEYQSVLYRAMPGRTFLLGIHYLIN